ncbi:MAG: lipopolysaccharide assembly protein LapA domain-containing protein [Tolumonas sp.]|nr:lipopolysaccharide assembly protein LapA domain-containing protein [Tolumonas sp.]
MKFVKSILYFIAILLLAMFLVTLGSVNGQQIHVNLLVAQDDFSLPTLLVAAFFSGFLVALCALGFGYIVAKLKLRKLQNHISRLTSQVNSPVKE